MRSGGNFQTLEETGVEEGSSTPVERNKFFSIYSTPGVEQLYSKILLRNGVERSSGIGVNAYTRHKTGDNMFGQCLRRYWETLRGSHILNLNKKIGSWKQNTKPKLFATF